MANDNWEYWGAELRRLREQAGKTQEVLAKEALLARSTLSALERGAITPKEAYAAPLDTVLDTGGALTLLLAKVDKKRDYPAWWADALGLEQRSRAIWDYEPTLVPGLLQTPEYAYEIIRSGRPHDPEDEVKKKVEQRTKRLPELQENGLPMLSFVATERALTRPVGDEQVMSGQLSRIEELLNAKTIRLQVLPEDVSIPGANLPFRINVLSESKSVVYFDYFRGGVTHDEPEKISDLTTVFQILTAESLSTRETLRWIAEVQSKWNGKRAATAPQTGTASK